MRYLAEYISWKLRLLEELHSNIPRDNLKAIRIGRPEELPVDTLLFSSKIEIWVAYYVRVRV